ncbi:hypothetical protein BOS5A_10163 [Bosea sp. EC-HK365B]|nr:hypothetical protein BOSE7B_150228 [Bosea sp. 7B]VVT43707.1 hypothetical protein BOS5A_10163 [Bosea sp. EC-HK365B]
MSVRRPGFPGRRFGRGFRRQTERHRANLNIIAKPGDKCPARNPKHKLP